jgi:hypothetical protein
MAANYFDSTQTRSMDTIMAKFTTDEMRNELRTIFLFEADHVAMGAGYEAAERFIGFPMDDRQNYCAMEPEKVDLGRFPIAKLFDHGYDFAFRPTVMSSLDSSEVQDLIVFMLGTPRAGGISLGGQLHPFMTPDGLCQTVSDAAKARWKLEVEPDAGEDFTTRELALLANMTEGAIRNALADKSENGLRAIAGSKNPVLVEKAEAARWLKGRRGFIPTPNRPIEDPFLREQIKNAQSAEALGQLIGQCVRLATKASKSVPTGLGWQPGELEAWISGNARFDLDRAKALAAVLDLDVPLFVGKALEVSLRREATEAHGGRS